MSTIQLGAIALAMLAGDHELVVREVTQPSLSISPDGETLYFAVLGDLVALPTTGGEARCLTSGSEWDQSPLATPDGSGLDFVTDRYGADALARLSLTTGEIRPVEGDLDLHLATLRHLPEGARAILDEEDRARRLTRLGASSSSAIATPEGDGRFEWAGLGPLGRYAVLAESGPWAGGRPERLRVAVVDLASRVRISEFEERPFQGETDRLTRAALSARSAFVPIDGDIVRVDLPTGERSKLEWSVKLTVRLPEAFVRRASTEVAATAGAPVRGVDRVDPHPDEDSVAFAMLGDLWTQARDGSTARLTSGPELDRMPQFGPAGEWIYFARDGRLARVRAEGGAVEVLPLRVATEFFDTFVLTPDARRVVHPISMVGPGIQVAGIDASAWNVLVPGRARRGSWVGFPTWANRGEEIVATVAIARGQVPQVYGARGGGEPQPLTELERPASRAVGSDDGRWLALFRDGRAWIAERGSEILREADFEAFGPVGVHSIEFSADSQTVWIAAGTDVRAFDCADREERVRLRLAPRFDPVVEPTPLRLAGCHVVDVEAGVVLRDRDVLLSGGRIASIEAASSERAVDSDVERIDAVGRYLIPGLFDMHVHQVAPLGPAILAWGVTSVRQLGSVWPVQLVQPELFQRGLRLGPRHLSAGEIFEGIPPKWGNAFHLVESRAEAEALVERRAADGIFEVKLYPSLSRDLQRAVTEKARSIGVGVTVHVASLREAVNAVLDGAACLEHWPEELPALHGDLRALMVRSGVAWCPTLSVRGAGDHKRRIEEEELQEPLFRATVPGDVLKRWSERDKVGPMSADNLARLLSDRAADIVRAIDDGVPVLIGSDCSVSNALVGPSTHWEMEFLVRAGLEPIDALRAATLIPAGYAGLPDFGAVRVGAVADLVLLSENPLADIRATRSVEGVIFGGRWLSVEKLQRALEAR